MRGALSACARERQRPRVRLASGPKRVGTRIGVWRGKFVFSGNPLKWWRDPEFRRFVRFIVVGGLNTMVGYGIFAGLIFVGIPFQGAIVIATVLGVLFNYLSTGGIVFRDRTGQLPRFIAVYVVQTGLNVAGVTALKYAGINPLIGGFIVLPFLVVFTFLAMRRFVFT
jgi:putative flippase GtrA